MGIGGRLKPGMISTTKIYRCECHTEGWSFSIEDGEVYLTGWQMKPGSGSLSVRNKLRWCWRIIRTGKPFNDHVILSTETAGEFVKDLSEGLKFEGKGL